MREEDAESSSSWAKVRGEPYQWRVSLSRVMLCQSFSSSSQVRRLRSERMVPPILFVTRQRYQMVAPGGSEPDLRISQVQETSAEVLPGSKSGNALAVTVPQVSFSTPYSTTTRSIVEGSSTWALKVSLSGNSSVTPRSSILPVLCAANVVTPKDRVPKSAQIKAKIAVLAVM